MASSINLNNVLLLLSLLVIISLVAPSTSNPTAKLTPELEQKVCLASGNPTCLQTLQNDPQAQTLNLADLTLSYVEKARNLASSTLLLLETLVGQTLEHELIFKYRHCWTHYKVALKELTHAKRRLTSYHYNEIEGSAVTALSRASDCDDEFEDRKFPRPSKLDRSNQELRVYGGIVLGLAPELVLRV